MKSSNSRLSLMGSREHAVHHKVGISWVGIMKIQIKRSGHINRSMSALFTRIDDVMHAAGVRERIIVNIMKMTGRR